MALAVLLSALLIGTGAPLWLRLIGYAAGFMVILRYAGVFGEWRKAWRQERRRALEKRQAEGSLWEGVRGDDHTARFARIKAARDRGDPEYLITALRDPDNTNRQFAAKYLGQLGSREAIPHLLLLLTASDPHLRTSAVRALGGLKAREAVDELVEVMRADSVGWVREWAASALGDIGELRAVPALIEALDKKNGRLRFVAARELAELRDPRAVGPLERARERELPLLGGRRVYSQAIEAILFPGATTMTDKQAGS